MYYLSNSKMLKKFVTVLVVAVSAAVAIPKPQAPQGTSADLFAPNGVLGGLLKSFGNITNGPAPKGCSKFEILVG
jgi:hypothetical protein